MRANPVSEEQKPGRGELWPRDPPGLQGGENWLLSGLRREKAGDYAAAADAYLVALLLEPRQGQILLGLARSYFALGQMDQAGLFLESLILAEPGQAEARLLLGLVRGRQGREEAAIRLLARPDDPGAPVWDIPIAREGLGDCHYRRGHYLQAIIIWLPLLDHPRFAERILLALGAAFFHLGRYSSAYAFFQEAVKQNPRSAGARNNCGVACSRLGDPAGARRWLEEALACDPALAEAKENLALVLPAAASRSAGRRG